MYELRRLFGLMVASKRKYIDPSRAIDTLRDAFAGANAAAAASGASCQQDVSEFQHKLLEWLEEAFACRMSDAATPASSRLEYINS
jgi:ubiquitin carboxyl-terminal hydrolase 25/28